MSENAIHNLAPKILIAVPAAKPYDTLPECLVGIYQPNPGRITTVVFCGDKPDANRNGACYHALTNDFKYLFMVDDDTFPPAGAFVELLRFVQEHPRTIAGAHYNKRMPGLKEPIGTSIVVRDGETRPLIPDGEAQEVQFLATGCICIPVEAIREIGEPWFYWAQDDSFTDDVFFSQRAREKNWTLHCLTWLKAEHRDRDTGAVY